MNEFLHSEPRSSGEDRSISARTKSLDIHPARTRRFHNVYNLISAILFCSQCTAATSGFVSQQVSTRIANSPAISFATIPLFASHIEDDDTLPKQKEQQIPTQRLSLMEIFSPNHNCDTMRMSGTDLAYIGDVIFELYARSRYVWPPKRTSELQTTVVECVRAERQSQLLHKIKEEFGLTQKELQIVTRGRNSVTRSRNNRRDPATYQDSTAFEALLGYLFIDDKERCEELLNWLSNHHTGDAEK